MKEGRCYLLGLVGGNGMDRVGAKLQHAGGVLCRDLLDRHHGWVSHCPERDMEAVLSVEARGGTGTVRAGFFDSVRPGGMPRLSWDGGNRGRSLEELIESEEATLARSGYGSCKEPRHVDVLEGVRTSFDVPIADGGCAVISVLASREVRDLDLRVSSGAGREFSDSSMGPLARVPVCAKPGERFKGTLIALAGNGKATILVNELPSVDLPVEPQEAPLAIREATTRFAQADLVAGSKQPQLKWSTDDEAWEASFDTKEGSCYGVAVASTALPLTRVEISEIPGTPPRIWKGPANVATLTLCPNDGGSPRTLVFTSG